MIWPPNRNGIIICLVKLEVELTSHYANELIVRKSLFSSLNVLPGQNAKLIVQSVFCQLVPNFSGPCSTKFSVSYYLNIFRQVDPLHDQRVKCYYFLLLQGFSVTASSYSTTYRLLFQSCPWRLVNGCCRRRQESSRS